MIWYFYGGGEERGVANDEIKQYEMCIRNNDFIGASAHAGIVSAAFQQAGDEGGYNKWKSLADDAMEKATKIEMDKYKYPAHNSTFADMAGLVVIETFYLASTFAVA